jgi:hypothetical protein
MSASSAFDLLEARSEILQYMNGIGGRADRGDGAHLGNIFGRRRDCRTPIE